MKFFKLLLGLMLVLGTIFVYQKFGNCGLFSKNTICVRIVRDEWMFKPDKISITKGEDWYIKIYNEDSFLHSFYINELNINQELFPEKETVVHINTDKVGTFNFFCSIICGTGHYRMNGQIEVR